MILKEYKRKLLQIATYWFVIEEFDIKKAQKSKV